MRLPVSLCLSMVSVCFVTSCGGTDTDESGNGISNGTLNRIDISKNTKSLIGGTVVTAGKDSVLGLQSVGWMIYDKAENRSSGCTIVRVGARTFLTAAHCGINLSKNITLGSGEIAPYPLRSVGQPTLPDSSYGKYIGGKGTDYIESTSVHSKFEITPTGEALFDLRIIVLKDTPDTKKFLETFAISSMELEKVPSIGLRLEHAGYGCFIYTGIYGDKNIDKGDGKLRYGRALVADPAAWPYKTGSLYTIAGRINTNDVLTIGVNVVQGCEGDSGGPVFQIISEKPLVKKLVGINSGGIVKKRDSSTGQWLNNIIKLDKVWLNGKVK